MPAHRRITMTRGRNAPSARRVAHARTGVGRYRRHGATRWSIIAALVVTAGAGTAVGLLTATTATNAAERPTATNAAERPTAVRHRTRKTTRPASALAVTKVTPAQGSARVPGSPTITVAFSTPIAPGSPTPVLNPSTAGSWRISGSLAVFRPNVPFVPMSQVTVTVPDGVHGVRARDGAHLARAVRSHFSVQTGSVLRLQQLLSLLEYSPLAWTPTGAALAPADLGRQIAALYRAPAGTFAWRQQSWPAQLTSLWHPGAYSVMTRGLVMSFQADHGLIVNGDRTAGLWNDLVQVLAAGEVNTGGYDYAIGSKTVPETLTIWHDGQVVLRSPANTGIPGVSTSDGTYPVFARYRNQVMSGHNPNGTAYSDPVQFVAYFHGGDAVHFFPRAAYGIPQSLGCIELPLAQAAEAWPWLAYGTLVTVVG